MLTAIPNILASDFCVMGVAGEWWQVVDLYTGKAAFRYNKAHTCRSLLTMRLKSRKRKKFRPRWRVVEAWSVM